ncbi:nucleoside-diphosphate sugar epimerase [Stutzerimonas stutzeri ATCC 14405 = CCUG 16156]|nr:nucleoside-diphosphate sugar epimerase [Stutzerimonas stutzeri ATCC 14405 = CCUG 16156]
MRNADFTRSLGRALSRPTVLPVPAAILKPMLGELGGLLLGGQHVSPQRLQEEGFSFRFSDLDSALADLLTHP